MEVLLLCDHRPEGAATVVDHINALCEVPGHRIRWVSILGDLPEALDLARFDAVMVHYSLILSNDTYVSSKTRDRLRAFRGVKAVFIQDEYRWVDRAIDAMNYVGIDILFTCVPESEMDKVYAPARTPGIRKVNTLTGFVPKQLLSVAPMPYSARTVDVGYRARRLSALFGALAREKWLIADRFLADASAYGLECDISCREQDRIYGADWTAFVRNCRAMLGSESGASVFDFAGTLQTAIETYEREHPNATYEEVRDRFYPGQDGIVRMNQISPRCFEAAALRTLMILYEGEYSGVLEPWRHYVPLRKNHDNMDEIVAVLRDERRWHEIVDNAYREVACNPRWSYERFGADVARVVAETVRSKGLAPARGYDDREFRQAVGLHAVALKTRRAVHGRLIHFVENLPPPLFRALRFVKREVLGFR